MIIVSCTNEAIQYDYSYGNKQINTYMQSLEANKNKYFKKEVDLNENSSQGAVAIGYFENNNLKIIESTIFGETGKKIFDVYFINEHLTYLVEVEIRYDKTIYETDFKIIEENIINYVLFEGKELFRYNKEFKTLEEVKDKSKYIDILNDLSNQFIGE